MSGTVGKKAGTYETFQYGKEVQACRDALHAICYFASRLTHAPAPDSKKAFVCA